MITKPMHAGTLTAETLHKVEWPMLCSPKIDGIRGLMHHELGPVSRSFKSIPNAHIVESLRSLCGGSELDGEIATINPATSSVLDFNTTQSGVMSRGGQPEFIYQVFDCFEYPQTPFVARLNQAKAIVADIFMPGKYPIVRMIPHTMIFTEAEFLEFVRKCLEEGHEGVCLRSPKGKYKNGRSTLNQGWLLKFKEWSDAEGTIIAFDELMHNENPDLRDTFNDAKRSSHKEGMIPAETLGALVIVTEWGELRVGTGFTAAQRQEIWDRNMKYAGIQEDLGRTVTFQYTAYGMQEKPRFPSFKGFRED